MNEVKSYSVYEGEIVVVEGFPEPNNSSKFNVSRIHKPNSLTRGSSISFEEIKNVSNS